MDRNVLGRLGEDFAANVLVENGYRIMTRNFRCRFGEIDIVAEKEGQVSFVEVKTRRNFNFGRPCEAIDEEKKKHMRRTAKVFLEELKANGFTPRGYGFDIMEIVITHTRQAF